MPTVRIDNEVFEKLKSMAEPFVDTPNSVLRRLFKLDKKSPEKSKQDLMQEKKGANTMNNPNNNLNSLITYSHTRLCFLAKHIEPLRDGDSFQIQTAEDGNFLFTKAEFYRVFPNVIKSLSYRENGVYHYPTVPKKALPFKVN